MNYFDPFGLEEWARLPGIDLLPRSKRGQIKDNNGCVLVGYIKEFDKDTAILLTKYPIEMGYLNSLKINVAIKNAKLSKYQPKNKHFKGLNYNDEDFITVPLKLIKFYYDWNLYADIRILEKWVCKGFWGQEVCDYRKTAEPTRDLIIYRTTRLRLNH